MKRCYLPQPGDHAIGETERFYTRMAEKGWLLEKRGAFLSRFRKGEPVKALYRVELAPRAGLGEEMGLPEEQVALYEDCGWEYVTGRGLIHVFRAPADAPVQELYSDPAQQAETLRALRTNAWLALLQVPLLVALYLLLTAAASDSFSAALMNFADEWRMSFVTSTGLMLFFLCFLAANLYFSIHAAVSLALLRRWLSKGMPIDRSGRGQKAHKVTAVALLLLCVLSLVLCLIQVGTGRTTPLPEEADGPYVLLEEAGLAGERVPVFLPDREGQIERSASLLAETYDLYQPLRTDGGAGYALFERVYALRFGSGEDLARALQGKALAGQAGGDGWSTAAVPGLDQVYLAQNGIEAVAVKGRLAASLTCIGGPPDDSTLQALLQALGQRWS